MADLTCKGSLHAHMKFVFDCAVCGGGAKQLWAITTRRGQAGGGVELRGSRLVLGEVTGRNIGRT